MKSSGRSVSVEEKTTTANESTSRKDKIKSSEINDNDKKPSTALAQARRIPVRPNLLRQAVVLPAAQNVAQQHQAIELAGVVHEPAPRRPARLPAAYTSRYSTLSSGQVDLNKPNRYSWAQRVPVASQVIRGKANAKPGAHFSSHLSSAASRVFVVNPMHIVNLSEHTKSRLIKIIEALKRFSEKWFSHVLLLLFLAVYACFGAYIFLTFESPNERAEKQLINDFRDKILNGTVTFLLSATNNTISTNSTMSCANGTLDLALAYKNWLSIQLRDYEEMLSKACAAGIIGSSLEYQWNFWGALFYSMTVFTTIGYGQLAPVTFPGRVATVAYAIFGIPILLMVLADLGKLLTRIIKFTFRKLHYLYNYIIHRKSSIRTRRFITRSTRQYKATIRAALRRWLDQITSYLRPPEPIRKLLLRFKRTDKPPDKTEEEATDNLEPTTLNSEVGDKKDTGAPLLEGTEVIVTPAKQSKPVSPQPGMHMSASGLIAGSVVNESRMARHQNRHHHRNTAPLHQHNHHAPGHHQPRQHRSQSPGQSGSRRKNSVANAKHLKNSVSRSSSSSIVIQQTSGGGHKTNSPTDCSANDKKQIDNKLAVEKRSPTSIKGVDGEDQEEVEEEQHQYSGELYEEDLDDELIEEDDFDIPVSFALFLLVAYMILGASLFGIWEGWDFFSSLYFVFISMSTIGFGDLVPKQQPKRMIGTFIYLLFGLALTSMCINVVQEKIHATFLRAKMQIGEKMGLDVDQIMAGDYYEGSLGPDDYDSQSVTGYSQSNSCQLHPSAPAGGSCDCCSECVYHNTNQESHSTNNNYEPLKSMKLSRGSNSVRLRDKNRANYHHQHLASSALNTHSGCSIPFLRKPSAKRAIHTRASGSSTNPANIVVESSMSMPSTPATGKLLEEHRQPFVMQQGMATVVTADMCRPLVTGRARLEGTHSQPSKIEAGGDVKDATMSMSQSPVCKSLSSELAGSRSESRCGGAQSVGSSRRSSVSQELNQLDDIIQTLGKSASVQRFGPLLGIPTGKSRPSRTSSPVEPPPHLLLSSTIGSSSPVHRRATSMIHNKRNVSHQSSTSKKSDELKEQVQHKRKATDPTETAQLAIEELEALKLSLT